MTLAEFRSAVETFLETSGMAERQLGVSALGDTAFVADLRAGREPRESTRQRVLAYIAEWQQIQARRPVDAGAVSPPAE